MSLRTGARRAVGALARLPLVADFVRLAPVQGMLGGLPGAQLLYGNGWDRVHPFDRANGTDTSGVVPAAQLPDEALRAHAVCYAGSQPSLVRRALASLGPVDDCTFLDLGCGKGRPLLVASEFPFRAIVGVELSPALAQVARRNAAVVAGRHPQRTAVRIEVADASSFALPAGDLVLFMYHPFAEPLVARVAAAVDAALAQAPRRLDVVYYNPVGGRCFDASPRLRRRFADMLPYAPAERGYGPDEVDAVVIWEAGNAPSSDAGANAPIEVAPDGMRALLARVPMAGERAPGERT